MPPNESVHIGQGAYDQLSKYQWEKPGTSIKEKPEIPVKYLMLPQERDQIFNRLQSWLKPENDSQLLGVNVMADNIFETREALFKNFGVISDGQRTLAGLAQQITPPQNSPAELAAVKQRVSAARVGVRNNLADLDSTSDLLNRLKALEQSNPDLLQEFRNNPESIREQANVILLINLADFIAIKDQLKFGEVQIEHGSGRHALRYQMLTEAFLDPAVLSENQAEIKTIAQKMLDDGGFVEVLNSNLKLPQAGRAALEIHTRSMAVLCAQILGKPNPAQYAAAQLNKNNKMVAKLEATVEHASELVTAESKWQLGLPDPARKKVDQIKFSYLVGGSKDQRILPMIEVLNKDWKFTEAGSREARQLILNIRAESLGDSDALKYSPNNLKKIISDESDELSDERVLQQMALYELALQAEAKIKERAQIDYNKHYSDDAKAIALAEDLFKTGVGRDLLSGVGFAVEDGYLNTAEFNQDISDAGSLGDKILKPESIAALYFMGFGGALMAIFNLMGYISHGDPASLAYAAAGIGAVFGGVNMVKNNIGNTFSHPENRVYNAAETLIASSNREFLSMYANYKSFFTLINLNEKKREFTSTSKIIEQKQSAQAKQEKNNPKETFKIGITKADLISGQFTGIMRDGAAKRLQTMASTPFDKYSPEQIYASIKWLYDKEIRNPDLHQLAIVAHDLRKNFPGERLVERLDPRRKS